MIINLDIRSYFTAFTDSLYSQCNYIKILYCISILYNLYYTLIYKSNSLLAYMFNIYRHIDTQLYIYLIK